MRAWMKSSIALILLAVFILAACNPAVPAETATAPEAATGEQAAGAPAADPTSPATEAPVLPSPTLPEPSVEPAAPTEVVVEATATTVETPLPVAETACPDRGPELHASNPADVQLASGKVQLVEFFAFW